MKKVAVLYGGSLNGRELGVSAFSEYIWVPKAPDIQVGNFGPDDTAPMIANIETEVYRKWYKPYEYNGVNYQRYQVQSVPQSQGGRNE